MGRGMRGVGEGRGVGRRGMGLGRRVGVIVREIGLRRMRGGGGLWSEWKQGVEGLNRLPHIERALSPPKKWH